MCPPNEGAAEGTSAESTVSESTENTESTAEDSTEPAVEAEAAAAVAADPNASKAEKKAAEKMLKKFKLKIDGEEVEETLDLSDEEAIKKHLQLSKSAQKRFQESAKLKKDVEQFIGMLKGDTKKVLAQLGIDPKAFAQQVINAELEEESKSPEQKELERLKQEIADRDARAKEEKETREREELERLQADAEAKFENTIVTAIEKTGLKQEPELVIEMASIIEAGLKENVEFTPDELADILKKRHEARFQKLIAGASDEMLEALLGESGLTRLQKRRVAKAKQIQSAAQVKSVAKEEPKKNEGEKKNFKEFFKL